MIIDLKKYMEGSFSLITPVYRPDERMFKRCFDSVMNQQNSNFRWLIFCDGAKAREKLFSFPFMQDLEGCRIKVEVDWSKKHIGVSAARNRLLDKVRMGFVGFLDADNWLHEMYSQLMLEIIKNNDTTQKMLIVVNQAVIGTQRHYDGTGHYGVNARDTKPLTIIDLMQGPYLDLGQIAHNCLDFRFDEGLSRLVDYEYMINLCYNGQIQHQYTTDSILSYYDHFKREDRIDGNIPLNVNLKRVNDRWNKKCQQYVIDSFMKRKQEISDAVQED